MKYIFAGKKETYNGYISKNVPKSKTTGEYESIYIRNRQDAQKMLNDIDNKDIVILLPGWWARVWTKNIIKEVEDMGMSFEYMDGKFGEEERKNLKSETIYSRLDMLDIED
jgi:hypothetical protein